MTSHVDADTLALSAEGLLEDQEERSVREHVAECAECAEQLTELAGVSRILAEVPAPPLPDTVAARLDDALRAEADARRSRLSGAVPVPTAPAAAGGNVVPLRSRFGSGRWLPYLAAAAAAVVVIGGGAAVVRGALAPDAGTPTAAAPDGQQSDQPDPDAAQPYRPLMLETGTRYTDDDLADQASGVLADTESVVAEDAPESDTGGSEPMSQAESPAIPSEVASCVHSLSGEGARRPELIDRAEFRPSGDDSGAEDAWVVYLAAEPGDAPAAGSYDVVVLSAGCTGGGDPADHVLAETTVSAPE
ncbi:anti-sigma factor family protein [Nocardiopsis mangrovi]|uniref:Anti-sigma factor family protein n=1 Tax=Nocardiopsis mangrovi TaxID=1179818 RepID=A0ABV9E300_9ACTN